MMEEYNALLHKTGHDNTDHCWSWSLTLHCNSSLHYNNWIFNDSQPQSKRNKEEYTTINSLQKAPRGQGPKKEQVAKSLKEK
jgi:hypothetical protein